MINSMFLRVLELKFTAKSTVPLTFNGQKASRDFCLFVSFIIYSLLQRFHKEMCFEYLY